MGGTRAAAIWDVIAGAFALWSEPVIHPFSDYSGKTPDEDTFDAVPAIGRPLGYDMAAAPGYKPVDHIEAALTPHADWCTSSHTFRHFRLPTDSRQSSQPCFLCSSEGYGCPAEMCSEWSPHMHLPLRSHSGLSH